MILKPDEIRSLEIYNTMQDFVLLFNNNKEIALDIVKTLYNLHDKYFVSSFFNKKLNITDFVTKITNKNAYLHMNGIHMTTRPFLFVIDLNYCLKKLGDTPNKNKYIDLVLLLEELIKLMYFTEIYEKVKKYLDNIDRFGDSTKLVFDDNLVLHHDRYVDILGKLNEIQSTDI